MPYLCGFWRFANAYKFNGPKGIGFLYINKKCSIVPYVIDGGQENGMRSGTENVAGVYSMAKAPEDNVTNMKSFLKLSNKNIDFKAYLRVLNY